MIAIAIDRLYQQEEKEKTMETTTRPIKSIEVRIDTSDLTDGWSEDEIEAIDLDASREAFLDETLKQIKRYWPEAQSVHVEDNPAYADLVIVDCGQNEDVDDTARYIYAEETAQAIRVAITDIAADGTIWAVEKSVSEGATPEQQARIRDLLDRDEARPHYERGK